MVNLTINATPVCVPEGSTILEAARAAGVHIPHLCYLKDINEIGACRVCSVEVTGEARLIPACDNVVREGMEVITNSPRVRTARRTNLALIMSRHNCDCAICARNGSCRLQDLASDFGLLQNPFPPKLPAGSLLDWDASYPLVRDAAKCIHCLRCIQVCDKIQTMHVWDLLATGGRTRVGVAGGKAITATDCVLCGQCLTHCPVGALRERDDTQAVLDALENPEITTVVQIAPAVRTAWGEAMGLAPEDATVARIAGALRQLGFDYVFDTCFSADLTIMEEGSELLALLGEGTQQYPMFTSCCPGWIRFVKSRYPQLVPALSTAKSPQQMFGAAVKTYFADKIGVPANKICSVSIMPCLAKKGECALPTMRREDGTPDVDYALTTRELTRLLRGERISMRRVKETGFDTLLGDATGAGVIFGVTGGVMEAALRSAYYLATGTNPAPDAFTEVRDDADNFNPASFNPARRWREATFELAGKTLRVAAVSGLANADALCQAVLAGSVHYDFVEVMACPGGCSGGGGQPLHSDDIERAAVRGAGLYKLDDSAPKRFSHENADVQAYYASTLGQPLSEKAEALLHTDHSAWKMPTEK